MYSTLRDYLFNRDIDDIRESAVYGPGDEKLGKVDDVISILIMAKSVIGY
jgi:hypothetical protein